MTTAQCNNAKSFIATDLLGAFAREPEAGCVSRQARLSVEPTNHVNAVFNWQNWQEPYGYNTAATVNNGGATQNGTGGTHERFFIANWTSTFSSRQGQ